MQKKIFQKFILSLFTIFALNSKAYSFPIYAQQGYTNPREATGRIVCANCHLAQKPTEIEAPSAVLPNTVFESVIKIPFDYKQQQILGNGQKGGVNVGAIMILPEGFKLAPKEKLSDELKAKTKGVYITPYSTSQDNILVVGPISGEKNSSITFPILSPDPEKNKQVFYVKYPIYVGANRGRGQVYPTGEKTNNNAILAISSGKITKISKNENNYIVEVLNNEKLEVQKIPTSYNLVIKENQTIIKDEAITENPNIGGFGQNEKEIVLQNPIRIYSYLVLCVIIIITQLIFVLKKKQFEKVQLAELDF
jgi:apocytochrome f